MRWTLKPKPDTELVDSLADELSINTILASILVQRGITTFDQAKHFFRPSITDLHDPYLMKGMSIAVQRIETAIRNHENILIYGDYDVDGTTAVSLMYSYLKKSYKNVATYIPDRYKEGYGVSFAGIDFAEDNDFSLIIALDCGIKAVEKVSYARDKNIDFIICDHHTPGEVLPNAVAILNPKQQDCNYPYKELCGCGVGFKLIQGLAKERNQPIEQIIPYLDLVAIATGADIVPITGENRTLTYFGLKVINASPINGIKAIIHLTQKKELTITDVVFSIAPRINAAGRMKHGNYAVALLTEFDFDSACEAASEIEQFNSHRKEVEKEITTNALNQIKENSEEGKYSTVVYDSSWHKGVIGIVASRLIETYYKPTVVFTRNDDKLVASVRSVKGFDVYKALEQCAEFIEQFGGHKYAAGLTITLENYLPFKKRFEEVVKNTISENSKTPEILIDSTLSLEDITPKFFRIIEQMAPFGPRNMKPVFVTNNVVDTGYGKTVGSDNTHLKLNVTQNNNKTFGAIGFGLGHKKEKLNDSFNIAYSLDENNWNGNKSIQLVIKDLV